MSRVDAKTEAFLARLRVELVDLSCGVIGVCTVSLRNSLGKEIFQADGDIRLLQLGDERGVELFVERVDLLLRFFLTCSPAAGTVNDQIFASDAIKEEDDLLVDGDHIIGGVFLCKVCIVVGEGSVCLRDGQARLTDGGKLLGVEGEKILDASLECSIPLVGALADHISAKLDVDIPIDRLKSDLAQLLVNILVAVNGVKSRVLNTNFHNQIPFGACISFIIHTDLAFVNRVFAF